MYRNFSGFEKSLVISAISFLSVVPLSVAIAERFNIPAIVFVGVGLAWCGIVGLIFIVKDKF